jgi:signal peptidase
MGTQGLAYIFFGAGALLFLLAVFFGEAGRRVRKKTREKDRDEVFSTLTVVLVAAFFLVLVLTTTMVTQGGPTKYEIVSSESNPDTPRVVPAGESVERRYVLTNPGYIPVVSFVEPGSRGVEVNEEYSENYLRGNETINATVAFTAPDELGYYPMYVVEHRYFAVLPLPMIRGLYAIHPWVPLVVINGLIAGAFVVFSAILVGTKPVRTRTRKASTWLGRKKKNRN